MASLEYVKMTPQIWTEGRVAPHRDTGRETGEAEL